MMDERYLIAFVAIMGLCVIGMAVLDFVQGVRVYKERKKLERRLRRKNREIVREIQRIRDH